MNGLGNRIKLARGARSQKDFALMLNVDRTTVGSWERDRREPDIEHLVHIADIAEVSLDWLVGRDNMSPEKTREYKKPEWLSIIDLANTNQISPTKLSQLINVALNLKG